MTNPTIKINVELGHVANECVVRVANADVDTIDRDDLTDILLAAAAKVVKRVVDEYIEDTRRGSYDA